MRRSTRFPARRVSLQNNGLTFSAANSNAISIADIDAGTNAVRVQLTATNGVITLSGISGLSFTVGDGTADGNDDVHWNHRQHQCCFEWNGIYTDGGLQWCRCVLQIVTNDSGQHGAAVAHCLTLDTVNITVNAGGQLHLASLTSSVAENAGKRGDYDHAQRRHGRHRKPFNSPLRTVRLRQVPTTRR